MPPPLQRCTPARHSCPPSRVAHEIEPPRAARFPAPLPVPRTAKTPTRGRAYHVSKVWVEDAAGRPGSSEYRERSRAPVAQWREQRFPKPRVAGSIPAGGALQALTGQPRRPPDPPASQPRCRSEHPLREAPINEIGDRAILASTLDLRARTQGSHDLFRPFQPRARQPARPARVGTNNSSHFTSRGFRRHLSARSITRWRGGYCELKSQAFVESWFEQPRNVPPGDWHGIPLTTSERRSPSHSPSTPPSPARDR